MQRAKMTLLSGSVIILYLQGRKGNQSSPQVVTMVRMSCSISKSKRRSTGVEHIEKSNWAQN